jgi:serine O-acetyltransferase
VTADVGRIVADLRAVRARWRATQQRPSEVRRRELPSAEALSTIVGQLRGALFPMRLGPVDLRQDNEDHYVGHMLDAALGALHIQVVLELHYFARHQASRTPTVPDATETGTHGERDADEAAVQTRATEIVAAFGASLPGIRQLLDSDVVAAFQGDPAARSVDEVLLCYPGIQAMIHHRLAHRLYELGVPLLARIVAEQAHGLTGIDIHPGAAIGPGFFVDHGTGVVIGETARIGRNVRLYQAVTLGAKRFATDADGHLSKGGARHPIVEDDVVVYAGATILGRITIGRGAVIGGNVWLTRDVPAGSHVSQASNQEGAPALP